MRTPSLQSHTRPTLQRWQSHGLLGCNRKMRMCCEEVERAGGTGFTGGTFKRACFSWRPHPRGRRKSILLLHLKANEEACRICGLKTTTPAFSTETPATCTLVCTDMRTTGAHPRLTQLIVNMRRWWHILLQKTELTK